MKKIACTGKKPATVGCTVQKTTIGLKKQLEYRADEERELETGFFPDELKAAIVLFFSLLDERKRRLYASLESLKWGHGGYHKVANLLGLDEKTVSKSICMTIRSTA
jgi:hypothetical protein